MVTPSAPRFEHHLVALGIGEPTPRLSWKTTAEPGWRQSAYQLELTRGGTVWTGARTESDESVLVPWPAAPLDSREQVSARVRVFGSTPDGTATDSPWSEPGVVEAGLLTPADWTAAAVGGAWPEQPDTDERRPSLVRRAFTAHGPVTSARLYASAHGLYEAELNGVRVGDDTLSPGWTVYRERLRYYTYDVTDLVAEGENVDRRLARRRLVPRPARLARRLPQPVRRRPLLHRPARAHVRGRHDARRSRPTRAGMRPPARSSARASTTARTTTRATSAPAGPPRASTTRSGRRSPCTPATAATLVAPDGPPVRCTQEVVPVAVLTTPSGKRVLDFGQNLSGGCASGSRDPRARPSRIRTAEVLQDGELYTRPLRGAKSTDVYTLAMRTPASTARSGSRASPSMASATPRSTGWPGDLDAAVAAGDVVARVYHTDLERTGWFDSSDPLVNQLHENVVWGMRSNFVDIPTDCPQRDERVGWTGDIQVFAPTASFLYDVSGMLSGWLQDVAVEQLPDGTVPWYVPVIPAKQMWTPIRPGAAWGDVAVLTPWALYERFGDAGILASQYDSAKAWVDLLDRLSGDDHLWNDGFQLGDWLDPTAPPQDPADGATDKYLVATGYFAWSARHLARSAAVLGKHADAEHYADLAAKVRDAFAAEYLLPDGHLTSDAQTAYSIAIAFDLIPDEGRRQAAGERLAELVNEAGSRIATGFAGTTLVSDALTATGGLDAAYELLLERGLPLVALPGGHGRHHDLGALGLDAARRHREPGNDDLVQPLRVRRGR